MRTLIGFARAATKRAYPHHMLYVVVALVAGLASVPAAWAQTYPDRPVRVIAPTAPGGPTDIIARVISSKLSDQLGKQFYVENIGGGGANIGIGKAAQAPNDGYTILFTASVLAINPSLFDKVPYDPLRDFEPVTLAVKTPAALLTIHPSLPANSVKELVALISANPGKYSYASPGLGTPPHLLGELFRLSLGLDLVHVPFASGGVAIGSTVAGHTPISFGSSTPAVPHVKEGKLRALAITGRKRSQTLPEVPTMVEAGYPEIQAEAWFGALLPAGTPRDIVALLRAEIVKVLAMPDVKERLSSMDFQVVGNNSDEFAAEIKLDLARWGKVIRDGGIKPR
jgi:tripartite-type tricarboxylate transporter receptor subunit TctC